MDIAFSTVACPEWPLDRVVALAEELGFDGLELRTFGEGSTRFACDPAMTDTAKLRALFADTAVDPSCMATGLVFDQQVWPPILGRLLDLEGPIRDARWAVRRAAEFGGQQVRVFGYQLGEGEKRINGVRRVQDRLKLVVATARNTTVRLVVENGGSFATADELLELLDGLDSRYVGASYNVAVAQRAGEDPIEGIAKLGGLLANVKLKDVDRDGKPCLIGEGEIPAEAVVRALESRGFDGWLTLEWDRAWFKGDASLPGVERALTEGIFKVYSWRDGLAEKKAFTAPEFDDEVPLGGDDEEASADQALPIESAQA